MLLLLAGLLVSESCLAVIMSCRRSLLAPILVAVQQRDRYRYRYVRRATATARTAGGIGALIEPTSRTAAPCALPLYQYL